jgi:hypothetical protein
MGLVLLAAAWLSGQPPADEPQWTLSLAGDYSSIPDAEPDLDSTGTGLGLSWRSDGLTLGGSLSALKASTLPPEFATASDGEGVSGSAFVAWSAGEYDLDLAASFAQQTLDGVGRIRDDAPPAFAGRDVTVDGETNSYSISFGAGRTFAFDTSWATPHVRLSWDQSTGETVATLAGGTGSGLRSNTDASGVSVTAGVEAGTSLASWLDAFIDVSGVFSASEQAKVFGARGGAVRPASGEPEEGAAWAEISAGFTIYAPAGVSLGLVAGGSLGREQDDLFGGVSLSRSF